MIRDKLNKPHKSYKISELYDLYDLRYNIRRVKITFLTVSVDAYDAGVHGGGKYAGHLEEFLACKTGNE